MDRHKDSELLKKRALQIQRGGARAAVLGVNDGLVSVLCIVLAVAGAGADTKMVLLSGFGALIAGAVSMAAGEWVSVRAQVELFGGVLKDLRRLTRTDKQLLTDQLAENFEATGLPQTGKTAAQEIAKSENHLVASYSQQVMGFNPDELGSPWLAAGSSFLLFTVGALAPLLPWLFTGGMVALWLSVVLTGVGSLIVGGYIGATSGRSIARGAIRQLLIVLLASIVTYGIGFVFGVNIS